MFLSVSESVKTSRAPHGVAARLLAAAVPLWGIALLAQLVLWPPGWSARALLSLGVIASGPVLWLACCWAGCSRVGLRLNLAWILYVPLTGALAWGVFEVGRSGLDVWGFPTEATLRRRFARQEARFEELRDELCAEAVRRGARGSRAQPLSNTRIEALQDELRVQAAWVLHPTSGGVAIEVADRGLSLIHISEPTRPY